MNDGHVISMRNVVKTYPGFELALPEFGLSPGHMHVLIGPNGAGKSTLLRLLIGLSRPKAGSIRLFDKAMPNDEAEIKLHTGYIASEMGFPPHMTAKGAIDYVANYYPGWSEDERKRLVEVFDVPENNKYNKLSTGQKIRTLLVTAFARGAKLLLLDEPFASLDPMGKETLKEEMMDYLLDSGNTILLATNEVTDIEDCIDFLHILCGGRIVVSGCPDELCAGVSRYSFKGNRRGISLGEGFKGKVIFKGEYGIAVMRKGDEVQLNELEKAGAQNITGEDVTLKDLIRYYFAKEMVRC